jgi:hypothetical protein
MMPSNVFPKHQVLNLNATVNANSAMKKSTIVCIMLCVYLYYARIMYLLDVGCWLLDVGCWLFGCWLFGCWLLAG